MAAQHSAVAPLKIKLGRFELAVLLSEGILRSQPRRSEMDCPLLPKLHKGSK
jgi:hypothetical protein